MTLRREQPKRKRVPSGDEAVAGADSGQPGERPEGRVGYATGAEGRLAVSA